MWEEEVGWRDMKCEVPQLRCFRAALADPCQPYAQAEAMGPAPTPVEGTITGMKLLVKKDFRASEVNYV